MNELELLSRYGKVQPVDPALIDATVDAIVHLPAAPARGRRRSSAPRRRVSRLVLVSASVAAAVAGAAIVVNGVGGSSSRRPAQVAQAPANVLTGVVVQHSLAALETTNGYVERVVQRGSDGTHTSWRGPTQLLDELPGQTEMLWTWAAPGVDTVLTVDYQHHTWSRSTFPAPQPPAVPIGGTPPPGAYLFSQKAVNGPEPGATTVAALFRQTGLEVTGTATVDGVATYELRIPALLPDGKPASGKGLTVWVNTRTYLPVRIAQDTPVGTPTWTQDFTWEPATPQALAVFDLAPPAQFHQVSDPAFQPVPSRH